MRPGGLILAVASTAFFVIACSDVGTPSRVSAPTLDSTTPHTSLVDARSAGRATLIALQNQPTTCLTVRGAIVDDQYIATARCDANAAGQKWLLRSSGQITLANDTRWCLDVGGQRGNEGDLLALGFCHNIPSQRWSVSANNELVSQLPTARCMTALAGGTGNARVRNCGSAPTLQRWFDVGGTPGGTDSSVTPPDNTTPIVVTSVVVTPALDTLTPGQTTSLVASPRDSRNVAVTGVSITWSSANPAVATVNASGLVTAVSAGATLIRATAGTVAGQATVLVVSATVPVASVSVSGPASSLLQGSTLQLSASTRDASGATLAGRAITWRSSNTAIATVNASGVVAGVAAGSVAISATSEGISGSMTLGITAPPPPPPPPATGVGEPTPTANVLFSDNFNGASSAGAGYAKRGTMSLVSDRSGGQAIRFHYSGGSPDNLIEKNFSAATDFYMTYWFRTSPGADPTSGGRYGSGMKWLMFWRSNGPRYTNGVGDLDNGGPGAPQTFLEFTTHDNGSVRQPAPFLQNVSKAKKFGNTNDGQWHRYTIHTVTGNGGYEQIWIDGVLVLDNRQYAYDHVAEGVSMFQMPGLVITGPAAGWEFTVDIDDIVLWRP